MSKPKESFDYEFGGPIGALATMIFLPLITLLLTYWASIGQLEFDNILPSSDTCSAQPGTLSFLFEVFINSNVICPSCLDMQTLLTCAVIILAWFGFQVFLERVLPGEVVMGALLPDGKRLPYRINGHLAFWVTLLLLDVGWPTWVEIQHGKAASSVLVFGRAPLSLLYDFHATLAFVTILWTILLSTYLYLKSFGGGLLLAAGGNSGSHFYDYFMGRELNPRWGTFDWKEFCELRPGLIGWMILNMSMMLKQYERLGYVTGSMLLINIFQGLYVWDALYQERAILTTMDITTDGFGFMLVFGDLAWVPFTYSLQARYLVDHDPHLHWSMLAVILGVNIIGYLIFRGANGQKDAFRRDPDSPDVSHLTFLQTKRGTKLLTSGWWGMARKINYTGDWIMGLSWCMVCGFESIVPYYYAIYFAILLVHRSIRDDHMCREKYGDDWDKYKALVPYRFIPGLF